MSYSAIVARIATRPHPNADRLQLGTVLGHQVVVGLETKDGDLGVYFPTDGVLSEDMCLSNCLYNKSAMEKFGFPVEQGQSFGYFSLPARVRSQKFRGEKSDGLWVPVDYLSWTGYDVSKLQEGNTFTELNDLEVCKKYYTPATLRAMARGEKVTRTASKMFPKHVDTTQFRFFSRVLPRDAVIYISEKLHGTSGRFGYVLDDVPLTRWQRWANYIAPFYQKKAWTILNGSRNVILEKTAGAGFYGTNEFRYRAIDGVKPRKGEVIFFEIVGYANETTPIMPSVDVPKKELPDVVKDFGERMSYTYGCPVGEAKTYVYRIAQINDDGFQTELPWTALVARCKELGLTPVPMLAGPITMSMQDDPAQFTEMFKKVVEVFTDGASTLDVSHIREGVCVRIESSEGVSFWKNKSYAFKVTEGIIKTNDSYVDLEEAA